MRTTQRLRRIFVGAGVAAIAVAPALALAWTAAPASATSVSAAPALTGQRSMAARRSWPVTVTVRTVPALAGIRLSWDGTVVRTDEAGVARFTRQHDFAGHTLSVVDASWSAQQRRYTFVRWAGQRDPDQAFKPVVTGLPMRSNYTVTAAFAEQFPLTATFVDQQGLAIAASRITSATLTGDDGRTVDLSLTSVTWLDGSIPVYRKSSLVAVPITYSLRGVVVDGVNAVDAGRQKIRPGGTPSVAFTVPLHDLRISSSDLLYGMTRGRVARITGPDGSVRRIEFDTGGTASLLGVPKGTYMVDIADAGGVVLTRQVNLSRDQSVEIAVFSGLDVASVLGAGLAVAYGLLLAGRAGWRRFLVEGLRRLAVVPRQWANKTVAR